MQLGVRSDPTELNGLGVGERKFPKEIKMLFQARGRRAVQTADGHHGHCHQEALWGEPSIRPLASLVTPDDPAHVQIGSQSEEGCRSESDFKDPR